MGFLQGLRGEEDGDCQGEDGSHKTKVESTLTAVTLNKAFDFPETSMEEALFSGKSFWITCGWICR